MELDEFITILNIVAGILIICLFFKVWKLCNNVKDIHKKFYAQESSIKEQVTYNALLDRKDVIQQLLDENIAKQYSVLLNCKEVFDEELNEKIDIIISESKVLYKKYGCIFPERFDIHNIQELKDKYLIVD